MTSWATRPRFSPFGLLYNQCFLNLFTVSVLPRCLPLHHPLQLPVTREDTVNQVHPQIHNPCHPHNPDTTICPITGSVHHCLALLIPTACRGKKRIASHSRTPDSRPVETMDSTASRSLVLCVSCLILSKPVPPQQVKQLCRPVHSPRWPAEEIR